MIPWRRVLPAAASVLLLSGCALFTSLPEPSTVDQRLAMFPAAGLPLERPVTIHWTERQVPFIEAETDRDAAFALGAVHAHLRLGQMEVLKRISQGRIAEMGGPIAGEIDHALRILDYGKVAPAVVAAMPPAEKAWLQAYVDGINHYQARLRILPHEFDLLGLEREPWTPEDVITLGRLASTDVTWLVWFRLLSLRDRPDWPEIWRRAIKAGTSSVPSLALAASPELAPLEDVLLGSGKFGSNSIAVGRARTGTGGALIANDPHLGLNLPNLWLIAGLKSPSYHVLGLMVPGLPFVAVGRNERIAWGGTNMRAASSDLFDVSDLSADQITTRGEWIGVRWWFDDWVEIRETPYGPILSDAPQITPREGEVWALKWIGHRPSDELSAMLRVNRATGWTTFREALEGFAVSPQNFLYADVDGNIGQVTATHLPARPTTRPDDIVRPRADLRYWDEIRTAADLPSAFNPPAGVLASANNKAGESDITLGYFFSSNDRIIRLYRQLKAQPTIAVSDLKALQQDTFQISSALLRDALLARWDGLIDPPRLGAEAEHVLDLLRAWDGRYPVESAGALAFEATMASLLERLFTDSDRQAYLAVGRPYTLIREDLPDIPDARLAPALAEALVEAAGPLASFGTWGEMHRLAVGHSLGLIPLLGGSYRFGDLPTAGSRETIHKTGHAITDERHLVRFGANSRHISDLSDPDANWFVLLGGQDGWFNSATFLDQLDLWQEGAYMQVPMRLDSVRTSFPFKTRMQPGGSGSAS